MPPHRSSRPGEAGLARALRLRSASRADGKQLDRRSKLGFPEGKFERTIAQRIRSRWKSDARCWTSALLATVPAPPRERRPAEAFLPVQFRSSGIAREGSGCAPHREPNFQSRFDPAKARESPKARRRKRATRFCNHRASNDHVFGIHS